MISAPAAPVSGLASHSPGPQQKPKFKPPAWLPAAPRVVEDIDIHESLLLDIAVRYIAARGTATIHLLADWIKLSLELTEGLFRRLNDQNLVEVRRMTGDDYVFALSPAGRKFAAERSLVSRYMGPAPVSLGKWTESVLAQATETQITREKLRNAFSDIVIEDDVLDALGPAMISRNAIFLYGPSGTGKTTVAERLIRIYEDAVVVPWAVEVAGQIVTIADPAVHQALDLDLPGGFELDPRWIMCPRPFVAVGGELVTAMLDLQKDETDGSFTAPLQMKASNGILLIDDFGRQMISPRDLLNRWIVPLDRRVDFLSFGGGGGKVDIPFELQIVFSTNLAPTELADEAFLRRIPNKVLIGPVSEQQFETIFRQAAARGDFDFESGSEQVLSELCLRHSPDLRACFPRDVCNILRAITIYEGRGRHITRVDLERAVTRYFV